MSEQIRLAELLGSLSFAGDLGRGQPMGHVLRTTRIAMALADRLRLPSAQRSDVFSISLLVHAGCTAGAAQFAAFLASDELSAQRDFCLCDPDNLGQLFGWLRRNVANGQPLPARTLRMLQVVAAGEKGFQDVDRGCSDVGSRVAARLGLSETAQLGLYHICETWNGKGPHKLRGEDVPLAARIVNVAMISEVFVAERGIAAARDAVTARKGKSFDPAVSAAALDLCGDADFWRDFGAQEPWASVLDLEPRPVRHVGESGLDDFCHALADIVDLKSTTIATHSRRTADITVGLARRLGLSPDDTALARRAALVHDVGLVGVPSLLLEKGASWSETDVERFRLHPYYTERILSRSEHLAPIGAIASAHHENVDGSGYHRGLAASQLSLPARVVAIASAYVEACESATGEPADPASIISLLGARRPLDPDCLAALMGVAGSRPRATAARKVWPAGLTEREVEVLRLVATGRTLKETAERLVISEHTARHHVESIYSKAGVSSRAGAVLFAVENGLLS